MIKNRVKAHHFIQKYSVGVLFLSMLFSACSVFTVQDKTVSKVPYIDEVPYYESLLKERPDLFQSTQAESSYRPDYEALSVKPIYRPIILTQKKSTYASIVESQYSEDLKKSDQQWAESIKKNAMNDKNEGLKHFIGGEFMGFKINRGGYDKSWTGYVYKVFFEFKDFQKTLTFDQYYNFAKELEKKGFIGDFKIALFPGRMRYQYNNLIIHAKSQNMALCAEAIGKKFFNESLASSSRGLDDLTKPQKAVAWHLFLIRGGYAQLPQNYKNYVRGLDHYSDINCKL